MKINLEIFEDYPEHFGRILIAALIKKVINDFCLQHRGHRT